MLNEKCNTSVLIELLGQLGFVYVIASILHVRYTTTKPHINMIHLHTDGDIKMNESINAKCAYVCACTQVRFPTMPYHSLRRLSAAITYLQLLSKNKYFTYTQIWSYILFSVLCYGQRLEEVR